MFEHLKLSTILNLAFGVLLAIMVIISYVSFEGLNEASKGFANYRNLARDTNLAGRLQANMLMVRLYVKEYFKTGKQQSVANYQARLKKLQTFVEQASQEIEQNERVQNINLIRDSLDQYVRQFSLIIEFKQQRDDLVFNKLDPAGLAMRTRLTEIMVSANNDRDSEAAYLAGRIQEHVLLARLYANKFLNTNDLAAANRFGEEIGLEIDDLAELLRVALDNPKRQLLFKTFIKERQNYRATFKQIQQLIIRRNDIIENQLDVIGPAISTAAEQVKLSVKTDQDKLGPKLSISNSNSVYIIVTVALFGIFFGMLLAWSVPRKIKKPIGGEPHEIMEITHKLALGDTNIKIDERQLATGIYASVLNMVKALKQKIAMAEQIAANNLDTKLTLSSPSDTLGLALQAMVGQLRSRSEQLNRENDAKAQLLSQMQTQDWIKTQQSQIINLSQNEDDLTVMARLVITELAKAVGAGQGLFYQYSGFDDDSALVLLASYAYKTRKHVANRFKPGEGLVGQCALEKQSILLTEVPDDYIQINSGLGQSTPLQIMVLPIIYNHQCLGVIELATFVGFDPQHQELLQQVSQNLGVIVNSTISRKKIQSLLNQSEQKTNELRMQSEELQSTNEELEEKADALNKQSEQLRQANAKLAEKSDALAVASKYKSEFLANMSHELRTPLNSLLILAKMLADNDQGNLSDEQIEWANVIYEGGNELLGLINDILDLSKVEAGKLAIVEQTLSFDTLLHRMEKQFAPLARQKSLTLQFNLDQQLPASFVCDGQRLEQVLKNLLGNAIKFTEHGGVSLNIRRPDANVVFKECDLTPANSVAFEIVDSGIGIAIDKQQSIFKAFQQGDGSISRKFQGTGLGLTISTELAKLLKGEIQMRSEPDKGSVFTFYLPLISAEAAIDVPLLQRTADTADDLTDEQSTTKSVLIVEDDVNEQQQLSRLFGNQGIGLTQCELGQMAVELISNQVFDCVILDLGLPDISGFEVLRILREKGRVLPPVMIYSAKDLDNSQIESLNDYDHKIIIKGVASAERLVEEVTRVLRGDESNGLTDQIANDDTFYDPDAILKEKTIMLVDDDSRNLFALDKALQKQGITVYTANNGQLALECLKAHPQIDLVIMDIMMPIMDGYEAISRIRSQQFYKHLPIIALTAKAMPSEQNKCLKVGANDYMAKPVQLADLFAMLKLWLFR